MESSLSQSWNFFATFGVNTLPDYFFFDNDASLAEGIDHIIFTFNGKLLLKDQVGIKEFGGKFPLITDSANV